MKHRLFGALLCALPVAAAGALAAAGTPRPASAQAFRFGMNGSDVFAGEGASSVILAEETLTFYIDDLPADGEALQESTSRVTASYRLCNPTQEEISLAMYLPVGYRPLELSALSASSDETGYAVETDGAKTAVRPRYTYRQRAGEGMAFTAEGELPRPQRNDDTFFRTETPVTVYTYTVTPPAEGERYTFTFTYDANPARTKVFSAESGAAGISNGQGVIYCSVAAGKTQEVVLYAVGDAPKQAAAGVYTMSGASAQLVSAADAPAVETTQFGALVQEMYAEAQERMGAGDFYGDFYNATVAMLTADGAYDLTARLSADAVLENLMLWYEYELTIPAGGSVVNMVTAPLFPNLPEGGEGRWSYAYLLSPGQRWAEVQHMTIRVCTSFRFEAGTLQFTEQEGGYVYEKDGLPMGELAFTVVSDVGAVYDPYPFERETPTLTTALIILGVVVGASAVTVAAVLLVRAHGGRKRRAAESRLCRGKTEEGKVDLDPFPPPQEGGEDKKEDKKGDPQA